MSVDMMAHASSSPVTEVRVGSGACSYGGVSFGVVLAHDGKGGEALAHYLPRASKGRGACRAGRKSWVVTIGRLVGDCPMSDARKRDPSIARRHCDGVGLDAVGQQGPDGR